MDEANPYLDRYAQGDPEAMGELMQLYRRPLFSFIAGMAAKDDAEDVFQEVWLRAISNLRHYKRDRFLSWLFRIAHNLLIDRSRKYKPEHSLQELVGTHDDPRTERQSLLPAAGHSPADAAAHAELAERIRHAVSLLPDEQREVFLLRSEADLPFKDIARLQNTSINTSLARMQYALDKLRQILKEDYENL